MLNTTPEQMTTLTACLEKAREQGYETDFELKPDGLHRPGDDKAFSPQDIQIENFYRFEGISDPADMGILYLVRANDGTMGTISDAYGTYADPKLGAFIKEVEEISKNVKPNKS